MAGTASTFGIHGAASGATSYATLLSVDGHRKVMSFLALLEATGGLGDAIKNPNYLALVADELNKGRAKVDFANGPELGATARAQLDAYRERRAETSFIHLIDPDLLPKELQDAVASTAPQSSSRQLSEAQERLAVAQAEVDRLLGTPARAGVSDSIMAEVQPAAPTTVLSREGLGLGPEPAFEPIHDAPVTGEPTPEPRAHYEPGPAREAPAMYRRRGYDIPTVEHVRGFLLTYDDGTTEIVLNGTDGGPFFHRIEPIEVA